jgi:hypothetical protein
MIFGLCGLAHGVAPGSSTTLGEVLERFEQGETPDALYDFYRIDAVRFKFSDTLRVRLRGGRLTDLANLHGDGRTLAPLFYTLQVLGVDPRQVSAARPPQVTEAFLDELYTEARANDAAVSDLNNIYQVWLPPEVTAGEALRALRDVAGIEYALFCSRPEAPPQAADISIPDLSDPNAVLPAGINQRQRYLFDAASGGIEARYAWEGGFHAAGSGVRIINVEYACNPNHIELTRLPNSNTPVNMLRWPAPNLPTFSNGDPADHGTAVLGILAGRRNGFGITGIAPLAELGFVSQWAWQSGFWPFGGFSFNDAFGAVNIALAAARAGDVIVLEMQTSGPSAPATPIVGQEQLGLVAITWERDVWDAVNLAVAAGRIVVAAAGNGRQNLDNAVYRTAVPGWPSGSGPFQPANNRAVLVGGAAPMGVAVGTAINNGAMVFGSTSPPTVLTEAVRTQNSNFGSAVDLHAWGAAIVTSGYGGIAQPVDTTGNGIPDTVPANLAPLNTQRNQLFTGTFGGTSGATPMVAGAAAVLQSQWRQRNGQAATQAALRQLLTSTGTPAANGASIGVMPNLRDALRFLADPVVLDPPAPLLDPPPGTYFNPQTVRMHFGGPGQNNSDTIIRYTLNGSEPGLESLEYVPSAIAGLYVSQTFLLSARAFRWDGAMRRWFEGPVVSGIYEFDNRTRPPEATIYPEGQSLFAQALVNNLAIAGPAVVELSADPGSSVFFNASGHGSVTDPLENWSPYTGPITFLPGTHWLSAYATSPQRARSALVNVPSFTVFQVQGQGIQPPGPWIFPNGGSYLGGVEVSLSHMNPNASLRYTLDGTEPEATSFYYGGLIGIRNPGTTVLKAKAFDGVNPVSSVSTATFVIAGTPAPPSITPASGTFVSSVLVSLSAPADTEIRYTINAGDPSAAATLYQAPFPLAIGQHLVRARAFQLGTDTFSSVASASITVFDPASVVQPPVIEPLQGNQTLIFTLRMRSDTEGAEIRWTLNDFDNDVTASSPLYNPDNPPLLGALPGGTEYFVKARAFKDGQPSLQSQRAYTVFWPFDAEGNRLEVAPVEVEPAGGLYHNPVNVVFRSPTPFVSFQYTTDNTEPLESPSTIFRSGSQGAGQPSVSSGFMVTSPRVLTVVGTRTAYLNSAMVSHDYRFRCAPPALDLLAGDIDGQTAVLSSETTGATIRYTVDGSEPDATSPAYSTPIPLPLGEHLLTARAFRNQFEPSPVSAFLVEVRPPVSEPVFTAHPADAERESGESVTFRALAAAEPVPAYQWFKDDLQIGDNAAELFLDNLSESDSGSYWVVASNSEGAATSEPAILTVLPAPGYLEVAPLEDLNATGPEGGPFTPAAMVYTLSNSGGAALDWAVARTQDWLNVSPATGTLAAGAEASVAVSFNANVTALAVGAHNDTLSFANLTSGSGDVTRSVDLTVQPAPDLPPFPIRIELEPAGATLQLAFPSELGLTVEILFTPSLNQDFTVIESLAGSGEELTYSAPLDPAGEGYYRVRVLRHTP